MHPVEYALQRNGLNIILAVMPFITIIRLGPTAQNIIAKSMSS